MCAPHNNNNAKKTKPQRAVHWHKGTNDDGDDRSVNRKITQAKRKLRIQQKEWKKNQMKKQMYFFVGFIALIIYFALCVLKSDKKIQYIHNKWKRTLFATIQSESIIFHSFNSTTVTKRTVHSSSSSSSTSIWAFFINKTNTQTIKTPLKQRKQSKLKQNTPRKNVKCFPFLLVFSVWIRIHIFTFPQTQRPLVKRKHCIWSKGLFQIFRSYKLRSNEKI